MTSKSRFALAFSAAALLSSTAAYAGCAHGGCGQPAPSCQGSHCYQLVATPPEYGTQSYQVQVAPERRIAHHTPAEYGEVSERIMVRPERVIAHPIPAVVETVADTVLVAPARKVWQVNRDAYGQTVGCWVMAPAQYAVRHRQVVVQPASVQHETIPAEYATRTRTVLVKPANVDYETIPAQYETRERSVLVRPASQSWQPVAR